MIKTVIKAPKVLCIYRNINLDSTYDLLSQINEAVFIKNNFVTLDLRGVEKITAAASVLLFATVNTCQLASNNSNQIRCIFPTEKQNPIGHQFIVKTGLARALHSGSIEKLDDLVISKIYFQSETNPSKHVVQTVNFLAGKAIFSDNQFQMLTSGIGEAMLNVSHHAYRDPLCDSQIHPKKIRLVEDIGERWWQCAWFDDSSNKWVFIICDLGLGIPFTYTQTNGLELLDAMREAFSLGKSRFQGQGRGNGSEDIKSAVGLLCKEKESLLVYSGGVKYCYNTTMKDPKLERLPRFFHGTLIEWTLNLG